MGEASMEAQSATTPAGAPGRLLRELSDPDFYERYACDRFTATILANRYRYVVAQMCGQFRAHSFSAIIRDFADLCGTISGPPTLRFPMAAVSETLPLFYGSIPDAVRLVLEEYGVDKLLPGDVVIVNDYYRVGTHLNDVCSIRPIFHRGELMGAVTIRAHMMDMGGRTMGGFDVTKRNVYEDGLRLPPMLLYSAGEPVSTVFKLLHDNTRLADLMLPDLKTMFHALELGERLIVETIDKYGRDAYIGAITYACDASAESMALALLRVPNGTYDSEEWIDGDGLGASSEAAIRLRVTKVGARAEFDFRGTSPATRSALNCAWPDVKTGVALALKFLLDPDTAVNTGTLRNIDIVVPPDTFINPSPPHACMMYFKIVHTLMYSVFGALNPVMGENAIGACWLTHSPQASGHNPDGTQWSSSGSMLGHGGPWCGTSQGDGDSAQQPIFSNLMNNGGVESGELNIPAVLLRSEYAPDSAGAGTHRGGAANIHDLMWLRNADVKYQPSDARRPSGGGGVCGGRPGINGAAWLWDGVHSRHGEQPQFLPLTLSAPMYADAVVLAGLVDCSTNEIDPYGEYVCLADGQPSSAGALLRVVTMGGGGWGDPFERVASHVLNDVRDEYVTIEMAARDYGVVVVGDPLRDPEGLRVDEDATQRLRSSRRGPTEGD
jgi:N-methylhydantoinase B